MKPIYSIYRCYCIINGKSYVGWTSMKWPTRQKVHLNDALNGNKGLFYDAIRKYKPESFVWEVLFQSHDADYTLHRMEEHFIREYESHVTQNGYNMTWGGEGTTGHKHTKEYREKKKIECINNGSASRLQVFLGESNYMKLQENREKIRISRTGTKKVLGLDGKFHWEKVAASSVAKPSCQCSGSIN